MSPSGRSAWYAAIARAELAERGKVAVVVGSVRMLLLDVDGEINAYRNRCPHNDVALDGGWFANGIVTCPGHFWRFDARTGAACGMTGYALHRHLTEVRDGVVWVSV